MSPRASLWLFFNLAVLAVLSLDLGLMRLHRGRVSTRAATLWTVLWVTLSLGFGGALVLFQGHEKGLQFFTGYVIEYALSIDNLFVFLLVFRYFRIDSALQHKLLFWGVLGAFAMRATLIVGGVVLVHRFHWLLYLFGAFLVFTAFKMLRSGDDDQVDPGDNVVLRVARRVLPVSASPAEGRFFTRDEGRFRFTSLFLVLLVVETTDLLFAFDSIPAVLGVSKDSFILYSSNVCAILGLRSLFFLLASLMEKLRYLKVALSVVLAFVGIKMLVEHWVKIPILWSFAFIAAVIAISVLASTLRKERAK